MLAEQSNKYPLFPLPDLLNGAYFLGCNFSRSDIMPWVSKVEGSK